MGKGCVLKSTGKWYQVLDVDGKKWECRIRGKLRMKGLRTTNPLAVGDRVEFIPEDDERAIITGFEPRTNYIIRKSVNLSHQAHIIAANIDIAFLVVTLSHPRTSTGFVDRFLAVAEAYHIPVVLVFNKTDIYDDSAKEVLAAWESVYGSMGYECLQTSVVSGQNIEDLQGMMKDKTTMLGGHSGVGKSTLINAINPGLELRTNEVSESHQKGQHTTTFAEMIPLDGGGFIIDTPGIKGFGIVDLPKQELSHYFLEMRELLPDCKFNNCVHINEPKCAVKKALEDEKIAPTRYESYWNMYHDSETETFRS